VRRAYAGFDFDALSVVESLGRIAIAQAEGDAGAGAGIELECELLATFGENGRLDHAAFEEQGFAGPSVDCGRRTRSVPGFEHCAGEEKGKT
jgi:hypothetical protein